MGDQDNNQANGQQQQKQKKEKIDYDKIIDKNYGHLNFLTESYYIEPSLPIVKGPMGREIDLGYSYRLMPKITIADILKASIKNRFYKIVNRENIIGIEVNSVFCKTLLEKSKADKEVQRRLASIPHLEKAVAHHKKTIEEITKEKPNKFKTIALTLAQDFYNRDAMELKVAQNYQKILSKLKEIIEKKIDFIPITEIPKDIYEQVKKNNDTRTIITYNLPATEISTKLVVMDGKGEKINLTPEVKFSEEKEKLLSEKLDSFHSSYRFVKLPPNSPLKATIEYHSSLNSEANQYHFFGAHGFCVNAFSLIGLPIPIFMDKNMSILDFVDVVNHETEHALGKSYHPWEVPISYEKYDFDLSDKLTTQEVNIARKDLLHTYKTTHKFGLPDFMNTAYPYLREVKNQTLRSLSKAYHDILNKVQKKYQKNVLFKINPEKDKKTVSFKQTEGTTSLQPNLKEDTHIVTVSGHCAGATIYNNDTLSGIDFENITSFETLPKNHHASGSYPNGVYIIYVENFLAATFENFIPKDSNRAKDFTLTSDLSSIFRWFFLSNGNDMGYFYTKQETHLYPRRGNDIINFMAGEKHHVYVKKGDNTNLISSDNGAKVKIHLTDIDKNSVIARQGIMHNVPAVQFTKLWFDKKENQVSVVVPLFNILSKDVTIYDKNNQLVTFP